ncbi:hypothetical protein VCRA2113O415_350027 [Vibrio crassostreae]|nr:hypothetical protein VCRA2113O415_350027 [Vibrio crassostreae]CAK2803143.1 hypothetical protein VCRA2113O420_340026 [Vibrio crassostreae]CAK3419271.1 hypothetical protein VCRA2121O436_350026 [Vibrio crassostreae]
MFGGIFRTGYPIEYAISAGGVMVCTTLSHLTCGTGFHLFFFDWGCMYQ